MKAQIEEDFAKHRDLIDGQAREAIAQVEEERQERHAQNESDRLKAYADAGLDTEGNPLSEERVQPDYFNRRVVSPVDETPEEPVEADPTPEPEPEPTPTPETPVQEPAPTPETPAEEPTPETSPGTTEETSGEQSGSEHQTPYSAFQ